MGLSLRSTKLLLSPSALSNYFQCPYKFKLSRENKIDFDSEAMRNGRLFEGYLFGFKENSDDTKQSVLEGRKKKDTLDFIKAQADYIRPIFVGLKNKNGDAYKTLSYEGSNFILRGEIDYVGELNTNILSEICGDEISEYFSNCIIDVKYTANVNKIWDAKEEKDELLQACAYPYMWYKKYGEKYPFAYLIVDSQLEKPIVRFFAVDFDDDFIFIKNLITSITTAYYFNDLNPCISDDTCGGSKHFQTRCSYVELCKYGRSFLGGAQYLRFDGNTKK